MTKRISPNCRTGLCPGDLHCEGTPINGLVNTKHLQKMCSQLNTRRNRNSLLATSSAWQTRDIISPFIQCMRICPGTDLCIAASVKSWVVSAVAALVLLYEGRHITHRISHLLLMRSLNEIFPYLFSMQTRCNTWLVGLGGRPKRLVTNAQTAPSPPITQSQTVKGN